MGAPAAAEDSAEAAILRSEAEDTTTASGGEALDMAMVMVAMADGVVVMVDGGATTATILTITRITVMITATHITMDIPTITVPTMASGGEAVDGMEDTDGVGGEDGDIMALVGAALPLVGMGLVVMVVVGGRDESGEAGSTAPIC